MKRSVPILLMLLAWAPTIGADGFVVVRPGPRFPDPTQLAVRYHDVDVTIRNHVAQVEIDQVFRNLNRFEVEGEYIFPIPDGAAVSDFVLYVDGHPVHAEAMGADEALRVYRDLIRQKIDPALLEYAGREMFRARIYPFAAQGERRVVLDYEQLVEREGGLYRFVYPLSTEKFSSRPLESAVVAIDLRSEQPIRNAYCPSHDVDIERVDSRHLRVIWEENGTKPDRDLILYYSVAEGPMDLQLVPYRSNRHGDDGYFMLLGSVGDDHELPLTPKDIVFVVDHSGSMKGEKIDQAREALLYCLQSLDRRDRFNIISFATGIDPLFDGLREADRGSVRSGTRFVRSLEAGGGTHIAGALDAALDAEFRDGRPAFLIFITDGLPTVGERDRVRILKRVERASGAVRIFPFGVGYDVDAILLDQLAVENDGRPSYVRPGEDLESRIGGLYDRIARPVMTELAIEMKGARPYDLEPSILPDIYRGGQLVLFGRFRGDGPIEVTLTGVIDGRRRSFEVRENPSGRRQSRNGFVGRLWATRRVGTLLREIRLYGDDGELEEEVADLGLRFGIVTPYTSFLVDDEVPDREHAWGEVQPMFDLGYTNPPAAPLQAATGKKGFEVSRELEALASARAERGDPGILAVRVIDGRTYRREGDAWRDTDAPDHARPRDIVVGSDAYFDLLGDHPELGAVYALGERILFQVAGVWYRTVPRT